MLQSPALIERREFKYLIDAATADRIREALRPFCVQDPFSAQAPNGRYQISSLYLDTPGLTLHKANEQELLDRYKLRVRYYPDNPVSPVFFEVKGRHHDAIAKTRGRVGSDWAELLSDPFVAAERVTHDPAVERFVTRVHTLQAVPIVLVQYQREAWTSLIDDYARITFDTVVESQPARSWSFERTQDRWRANDDPQTQSSDRGSAIVLELKFTRDVPSWLMAMVQRLNLSRRSFSKYGTSIEIWRESGLTLGSHGALPVVAPTRRTEAA
ncbi:MAG: hypothetical protein ACI9MR_002536 [Myxococcota bacterium]